MQQWPDGVCQSYLTALCNTGSIPYCGFTLVFAFSPPETLASLFLSSHPPSFHPHPPVRGPIIPGPTPALPVLSSIFFLPAFLRARARPASLSHVVADDSLDDWLFLRLLKRMPERDWRLRVGSGHAGWASMWRQENIWFIRPVGRGGKLVTRPPRHRCVTFQIQSTLCSSGGRSEHAAQRQRISATI